MNRDDLNRYSTHKAPDATGTSTLAETMAYAADGRLLSITHADESPKYQSLQPYRQPHLSGRPCH